MKAKCRTVVIALAMIVVAGLCVLFVMRRSPGLYRVTILPSLEGGGMAALGINDSGQVVGVMQMKHGPSHFFLWDHRQGMQDLGYAYAPYFINNAGQIAGTILDPNGHRQAALWEPGVGWMPLGTLGGASGYPGGINDRGQVVGTAQVTNGRPHAFLWDKNGGMRDLGTLGGRDSEAHAINDAGEVFGLADTPFAENQPFVWDPNAGMTAAGPLPPDTRLNGLNNHSWTVGAAENLQPNRRMILWSRTVGVRDLFPLDWPIYESVLLNDANQVVFREVPEVRPRLFAEHTRAYLWDPQRGKILLDAHLPLKRRESFRPADINNKGSIVGNLESVESMESGEKLIRQRAVLLEPIPERWGK